MMLTVCVIDGMGGGIGAEIIQQINKEINQALNILALGTNAIATDRMIQARAGKGATGENAIKINISQADYILGPIGIILPNGLMGEITPAIAESIMNARGEKLLLPINHPRINIIGMQNQPLTHLIKLLIEKFKAKITA